jgi:predicted acylesterase/phospholipase RssA
MITEGLLPRRRRWTAISLTVALMAAGCFASRTFPPPGRADLGRFGLGAPKNESPDRNPLIMPVAATQQPASRTILAISGGGSYGAYTAGVIKGWTASGTRPQFDVVTGVSTGALIAPFAFLGPDYDAQLELTYTSTSARDIFRIHSLPRLPWSDAVADSAPLRRLIEAGVTPKELEQIAAAHRAGRRLYVGTTDLDTKRAVVWDMGAIAAGDDPNKRELFCKVLLASASVPGLMPPVPIDIALGQERRTELHVDGAISTSVFVYPGMVNPPEAAGGARPSWQAPPTRIFVLVSGKLAAESAPVSQRLMDVAAASLNGVFVSRLRDDVQRIFRLAQRVGAEFAVARMADDYIGAPTSMSFEPAMMRKMFDEGFRSGLNPAAWPKAPPGVDHEDPPTPRAGVKFPAQSKTP